MEKLKTLLFELVDDFEKNRESVVNDRLLGELRTVLCPEPSAERYNTRGHQLYEVTGFDHHSAIQVLRIAISKFESTKAIVEWIIENDYWDKKTKTFEEDLLRLPSIHANVVAGFLVRNFQINNYQFNITSESFTQAFDELAAFLKKSHVQITTFLSLQGPSGNLHPLQLDENVGIIKADHRLTELFNRHYGSRDPFYLEMYDGDYLLKLEYTIGKDLVGTADGKESDLIKKWFLIPLLSGIGNIEQGKIIRQSAGWAVVTVHAPHLSYYNINRYGVLYRSGYSFTADGVPLLSSAKKVIAGIDVSKVDMNFRNAINRVRKAKGTTNLDDRVVELALALEYIINTDKNEITLQLRLKGTKLNGESGQEENCYNTIKDFYNLRSNVVHGNATLKNDEKTRQTIAKTEIIILRILLRVLEFNKKYTYKQISSALSKCLYLPKSLEDILNSEN
jgi:hypothetical protein